MSAKSQFVVFKPHVQMLVTLTMSAKSQFVVFKPHVQMLHVMATSFCLFIYLSFAMWQHLAASGAYHIDSDIRVWGH